MLVKNPKYRKQLSDKQVRILKLAYKFRFLSVPLVAEWVGKDKSSVYEQLLSLVEQGYLLKNYDSSYRLQGKSASYALAAKGIKYLRDNNTSKLSEAALRNMYKNRTASEPLVVQSLDVFKLCLQLIKRYPDTFELFTRSELTPFKDEFVWPLPHVYLHRCKKNTTKPETYQIELLEPGVYTWVLRKRIQAHEEQADELDNSKEYPTVLFVATNISTEKRIHKLREDSYLDFGVWTTTLERLASDETKIWCSEWWEDEEPLLKELA